MLACDGSVTTLCARAFVKTRPAAANRSKRRLNARGPRESGGVGPPCVDRDEDDVHARGRGAGGLLRSAAAGEKRENDAERRQRADGPDRSLLLLRAFSASRSWRPP